jgi:hypothetical protein
MEKTNQPNSSNTDSKNSARVQGGTINMTSNKESTNEESNKKEAKKRGFSFFRKKNKIPKPTVSAPSLRKDFLNESSEFRGAGRALQIVPGLAKGAKRFIAATNGGNYSDNYSEREPDPNKDKLKRWFEEKWVDVKTGKPCGRPSTEKDKRDYPACRPSKRINEDTPKTSEELSEEEKKTFKETKKSGERIPYNHKKGNSESEKGSYNKNIPKDKDLYDQVVREAKQKFKKWPSAYASGWVVKTYKSRGGTYETKKASNKNYSNFIDMIRPKTSFFKVGGSELDGFKKEVDDMASFRKSLISNKVEDVFSDEDVYSNMKFRKSKREILDSIDGRLEETLKQLDREDRSKKAKQEASDWESKRRKKSVAGAVAGGAVGYGISSLATKKLKAQIKYLESKKNLTFDELELLKTLKQKRNLIKGTSTAVGATAGALLTRRALYKKGVSESKYSSTLTPLEKDELRIKGFHNEISIIEDFEDRDLGEPKNYYDALEKITEFRESQLSKDEDLKEYNKLENGEISREKTYSDAWNLLSRFCNE